MKRIVDTIRYYSSIKLIIENIDEMHFRQTKESYIYVSFRTPLKKSVPTCKWRLMAHYLL
jgi:hypothetical protein